MLRREPSSELFWMLGMRRSTKPRSRSQPRGHGRRHPLGERHEQLGEVGAVGGLPVAGHVGLADTDLRVVGESLEEGGRAHDLQTRAVGAARAAAEQRSVGHDDVDGHPLGDLRQDAAGQSGPDAQHPEAGAAQADGLRHREDR